LIEKIKIWASLSKGLFPIQQCLRGTEQDNSKGSAEANGADAGAEKSYFVRFSEIPEEDQVLLFSRTAALNLIYLQHQCFLFPSLMYTHSTPSFPRLFL
jgi:hypothetical protein